MRRGENCGKAQPAPRHLRLRSIHIASIKRSALADPEPIENQNAMKTHNLVETPAAETYAAPARDSDGRGRGHSASGHQDRRFQRPGAFPPSSVLPGSLAGHLVQRHQDASAAPFQVQGVQHSDVGRPLDDGLGVGRAAGCLDGRQMVAPSSLRAKSSRMRDFLSESSRRRRSGDRGNGEVGSRARQRERRQAAISVSERRPRRLWIQQTRMVEASIGTSPGFASI